jgi:hypothetical protein
MFTQLYRLTTYLIRSGWRAYDVIRLLQFDCTYCTIPYYPYGVYHEKTNETHPQTTS